jgi:hypothetical protein
LHYVGREDPGDGHRNRAAQRPPARRGIPHARIRRTPAPAAASRSKTPDQNLFTRTTRNTPEPLDTPLLTLVISSPDSGVFAVTAAGPEPRRGHVICSGVVAVAAVTAAGVRCLIRSLACRRVPLRRPGLADQFLVGAGVLPGSGWPWARAGRAGRSRCRSWPGSSGRHDGQGLCGRPGGVVASATATAAAPAPKRMASGSVPSRAGYHRLRPGTASSAA